jgi:7-cyano-7-deazaguanine synthase in queuosine biosynthesis
MTNLDRSLNSDEMKPIDTIILFGGGIDSAVLCTQAYNQGRHPLLLYFNYGAKATRGELGALYKLGHHFNFPTRVAAIPPEIVAPSPLTEGEMQTEQARNEVPARNVMFMALGFSLAIKMRAHYVWIGSDPTRPPWEGFRDSRQPTIDAFNAMTAYAYGDQSPRVYAPLLAFKDTIYYVRHALVTLPNLLDLAFTCYESKTEEECGVCNHCKRKARLRRELPDRVHAPFAASEHG